MRVLKRCGRRILAAAPSCGPSCIEIYNTSLGSGHVLDVFNQTAAVGQPVILDTAQNTNQGEDVTYSYQGW